MKSFILIFCIAGVCEIVTAQTNTFPSSGNVGIGTASPQKLLHIVGSGNIVRIENTNGTTVNAISEILIKSGSANNSVFTNNQNSNGYYGGSNSLNLYTGQNSPIAFFTNGNNERMRIGGDGYVGIGTTTPTGQLTIQGVGNNNVLQLKNKYGELMVATNTVGGIPYQDIYKADGTNIGIHLSADGDTYFNNGNVGIGTASPTEKLSINGKIRAREIKVETTGWADYVFEPSYQLPDLNETEQFIKEHKHLPEIPSAKEVAENGVNLGEMNSKLLKKIEELTLYLIEKDKQVTDLQERVKTLEGKK